MARSAEKQFRPEGERAFRQARRKIETGIRTGRLRSSVTVALAIRRAAARGDVSGHRELLGALQRERFAVALIPAVERAGIDARNVLRLVR